MSGVTMPAMIKRWLRRRLQLDASARELRLGDTNRQRGALVKKGRLVALRAHVPANRDAFQRWYADREIASLLRHDLEPLTMPQSRGYFDTFILPLSARGTCFAIHERKTKRLIGTTALTDRAPGKDGVSALFRIVIGEKDVWGNGYGTEATRLVVETAFDALALDEVRLEVFQHNNRALRAYMRVGFEVTGEHVEWVSRKKTELRVIEMRLSRHRYHALNSGQPDGVRKSLANGLEKRQVRRAEREAVLVRRRTDRADRMPTTPDDSLGTLQTPEPGVD